MRQLTYAISAFRYCTELTEITIPASVTKIGNGAFYDCTGLARITYNGKMAEWIAVKKGSQWITNTDITTVTCSDGTMDIVQ